MKVFHFCLFVEVYLVSCVDNGVKTMYALKLLSDGMDNRNGKEFREEISMMERLHHPNVIRIVDSCTTGEHCFFVKALVAGGSLYDIIANWDANTP